MQDFQQRVVNEHNDLLEKLQKLVDFTTTKIFHGLDPAEQRRLMRQVTYMGLYAAVLQERIEAFT